MQPGPPLPRERYSVHWRWYPASSRVRVKLGPGFHSNESVRVTLESVSHVPAMSVHFLSRHTVHANQKITLDATDVHLLGGRRTFPKVRSGSRLNETHHNPPTRYPMLGTTILTALLTPRPPPRAPIPVVRTLVRAPGSYLYHRRCE